MAQKSQELDIGPSALGRRHQTDFEMLIVHPADYHSLLSPRRDPHVKRGCLIRVRLERLLRDVGLHPRHFRLGRLWPLWAAIGWHALVNAVAVYINGTRGAVASEGTLAGLSLISVGILWATWRTEQPS